ncbi:MAG: LysM peptidoglycan-binding domain-containing protein [Kiritimatiellae bacterium]|nr:LysM peptidoglycan-binding domain-containing protein [Kiritimatiellia bacterium]
MKKIGIVLGAAAALSLAGCKDPGYNYVRSTDVAVVEDTSAPVVEEETPAVEETPVVVEEIKCQCAPGTKHTSPCACGASNCACVVEVPAPKPVEPAYTTYIVQRGDYLAKISKKFNITVKAIKDLNPQIKDDNVVKLGQKLKLPGKVDVGAQTVPAGAKAETPKASKEFKPYTGATKEYTIKSGDTLGKIAYGNGINIRQLKEMNKMTSDVIHAGQKIKIPADGKAVESAPKAEPISKVAPAGNADPAIVEEAPAPEAPVAEEAASPVVEEAPVVDDSISYTVLEGEDLTAVSIKWGVSPSAIRELNNMSEGDQLSAGQTIKLPAEAQQ